MKGKEKSEKIRYYAFFSLFKGPLSHYAFVWSEHEQALCLFQLPGRTQKETREALFQKVSSPLLLKKTSAFPSWVKRTHEQISLHFEAQKPSGFKDIPLSFESIKDFQKKVYAEVCKIPFGKVLAYSDIAHRIQCPGGARQVGRALSLNPFPILIPCHRVIRKGASSERSGSILGGFTAPTGLEMKKRLLSWEVEMAERKQFMNRQNGIDKSLTAELR